MQISYFAGDGRFSSGSGVGRCERLLKPKCSLNPSPFGNGNVAVDGKIRECFNASAGPRPANFEFVYFHAVADAKNLAWVMRREITTSPGLQAAALQVPSLPGNAGSDSVRIGALTYQSHATPVIALRSNIFQ